MSKFKVGDRVRITSDYLRDWGVYPGDTGTVMEDSTHPWVQWGIRAQDDGKWDAPEDKLELVTKGDKPMGRRTFRQLKEDSTVKKGAIWQEECDDGDQPYRLLDSEFHKGGATVNIEDRSLVEDQPDWFEEVFNPAEMWLTKEELDKFTGRIKPKTTGKRPGYSKYGKKLGRPAKKGRR